ncbi:MAG: hypothetical protein JJT94_05395 [Bernardetiaceae bacterium]|nr:hypothetical protein [Bernardetiaceae bacterium]
MAKKAIALLLIVGALLLAYYAYDKSEQNQILEFKNPLKKGEKVEINKKKSVSQEVTYLYVGAGVLAIIGLVVLFVPLKK